MGRKGYPRRKNIRKSDLKPFFNILKFGTDIAKETGKELSNCKPPTNKAANNTTSHVYGCLIAIVCIAIVFFIGFVIIFDNFFFPFIIFIALLASFLRGFK